MKNGEAYYGRVFRRRRFWPQIFWLIVLSVGCAFSCIFNSTPLFIASVLAAFLGLTESSRWSHKTNLLVCASAAVIGSVCGVFTWFDTASIFLLLVSVGGFMLYYRDSDKKFMDAVGKFSSEISKEKELPAFISSATDKIREMTAGDEVFIAVADRTGSMYMPGRAGRPDSSIPRNGGAAWKVFASGRPYFTQRVESAKDLPFYRDARALISAPLFAEGEKIGVLQIESRVADAFSEEDIQKLELIAFVLSHPLYVKLSDEFGEKEETKTGE
ncbi:MAG: GAF domain-containing protein [Bacteroidia bacterium]|nr:GAF domain-containing protein [Bacteroidia bacterium]